MKAVEEKAGNINVKPVTLQKQEICNTCYTSNTHTYKAILCRTLLQSWWPGNLNCPDFMPYMYV